MRFYSMKKKEHNKKELKDANSFLRIRIIELDTNVKYHHKKESLLN